MSDKEQVGEQEVDEQMADEQMADEQMADEQNADEQEADEQKIDVEMREEETKKNDNSSNHRTFGTGLSDYLSVAKRKDRPQPAYSSMRTGRDSIGHGATIGRDLNVQVLGSDRESISFIELTDEFPTGITIDFPPDMENIHHWNDKLQNQHLVILSSHDEGVATSAGYALMNEPACCEGSSRRLLSFRAGDKRAGDAFDGLLAAGEDTNRTFVLVDAQYLEAERFVQSLLRKLQLIKAKSTLKKLKRYLIVLTDEEFLKRKGGFDRDWDEDVPYCYVDYLKPLVSAVYGEKATSVITRVSRIREQGTSWGGEAGAFYASLRNFLARRTLEEELDRIEAKAVRSGEATQEKAASEDLIQPRRKLENAVLFTATFFPDLSVEEFQRVLFTILADQTIPVPVENPEPENSSEKAKDAPRPVRERLIRDIWTEEHLEVMTSCHLDILRPVRGTRSRRACVDFLDPRLRAQFKDLFLGTYRFVHLGYFRRVTDSGLLFDRSTRISHGMVRLIVTMAVEEPDDYGHHWLMEMIRVAGPEQGLDLSDVTPSFRTVFIALDVQRRALIMDRLSSLATEMLETPGLKGIVDRFMNQLIDLSLFPQAQEMTKRLEYAARFDALYWLRQLIDRGDGESKKTAARRVEQIMLSGIDAGDPRAIMQVSGWLPDDGRRNLRPSTVFALRLLIDLCGTFVFSLRWQKQYAWPPPDPILRSLVDHGEAADKRIVRWLFHPGNNGLLRERLDAHLELLLKVWLLPPAMKEILADAGQALQQRFLERWQESDQELTELADRIEVDRGHLLFQAIVLTDWAILLLGNEDALPPDASHLIDRLATAIRGQVDRSGRQLLNRYWTTLETLLLESGNALDESALNKGSEARQVRSVRARLSSERRCVRQLRLALTMGHAVAVKG